MLRVGRFARRGLVLSSQLAQGFRFSPSGAAAAPGAGGRLLQRWVLRSDKDGKKKDEDEEEEVFKDKSLWEMLREFMEENNNKYKAGGLLLFLLLGVALLERSHELFGVEFGLYREVRIDELERLLKSGEVARIKVFKYFGDYNETYKALLFLRSGKRVTFNVPNPDNFIAFVSDLQTGLGTQPREHVPLRIDAKTRFHKTFRLSLLILSDMFYATLFFYSIAKYRQLRSELRNLTGSGKSIKKFNMETGIKTKFADVAGMEESKHEIQEFVDFLKNPKRYHKLGAKIPRGALMYGPPGTGKTMLAKACAGEANVNFFYTSGSEFVEMYTGVGASRVRELFAEAKKHTPSIIFIDEIDAIGKKRDSGSFTNDERDTTLNQLLVEMDGFGTSQEIVVFAATNRKDILDSALTRTGRFDRMIEVNLPDLAGRVQIFQVHLKNLRLTPEETEKYSKRLATITPGFSGSEIANVCNEAAILSSRNNRDKVAAKDFEDAVDRVIGGLEMKRIPSKKSVKKVAYHESGHGLVSWFLEGGAPLLKLTIVPRSKGSLGYAQYLPSENQLQTEQELRDRIAVILAGRIAEEVFFGEVSTGAYDDLQKAFQLAEAMVTKYGMSTRIGLVQFPETATGTKLYSEETNQIVDEEIQALIVEAELTARRIITEKKPLMERLAERLLERETISITDITEILGPRPFAIKGSFKSYLEEKETIRAELAA